MNFVLLQNSLLASTAATILSLGFGFASALFLAGIDRRWRSFFIIPSVVALALPPFQVANCWLHYFGQTGIGREWLPFNIYSRTGVVWILTLLNWPISALALFAVWRKIDPAALEGEPMLTGFSFIRSLLAPMARVSMIQAAALTFVLSFNNFAVPAILQVKVFPAELWVRFSTTFDYWGALQLSWPMVLLPLAFLAVFRQNPFSWIWTEDKIPPETFRKRLGPAAFRFGGLCTVLILILSAGIPLWQLAGNEITWRELWPALAAGQKAVLHSFLLASLTATLVGALALATWSRPVGTLVWIPFLIPGILLGIILIWLANRPPFIALYQSAGIVLVAYTIRYLGFGWNGVSSAMRMADRDLADAASLEGANAVQLIRHVYWPQIAPQFAAAWYVTYLLCLWDVETLILIMPPGMETLALRIFNLLHYGHNSQVNALCLLLIALALLPLILWHLVMAPGSGKWRRALACASLLGLASCSRPEPARPGIKSTLFSHVQIIGSRGTGLGQFNKPRSVAVDANDNLFVVDMTGRVQKFSPDGVFLASWQMPQTDLGKPKGMGRDASGNIIVIEPHYSRVNHFSPDGRLQLQWGVHGTNAGQLAFPRAVAVNSHGEIYVSEYGQAERVQRFTAEGKKILNAFGGGGAGPGEFNRPEGIGCDHHDRLYVADSCNHRIQIFSPEGKFLGSYGKAGSGSGELSYPADIRVDGAGRQYVCEFGNSRVQIFDSHDRPLEILGGAGSEPGQFSNPWSITLDSAGHLYVADSMNHRVQKFFRREPEK